MNNFKYKYVIAGGAGFYDVAYSDIKKLRNVIYHSSLTSGVQNRILNLLTRLTFNIKINRFFRNPLTKITYPRVFSHPFMQDDHICFIFFGCQYAVFNSSYLEYIRKKYKNAKIVLYMQDIVSSLPYYNINKYKEIFDLVLSYDLADCKKFNLVYYPTPYSIETKQEQNSGNDSDIYFCGSAKNRYKDILEVYKICKANQLKCKFYVTGVPENDQIKCNDIIYNKKISYQENIANVLKCKCILEVMQEKAVGYTPRLWESIAYDKHLLTNNTNIKDSIYFTHQSMHTFDKLSTVKEWINAPVHHPQSIKSKLSPINLLKFIEDRI